MRKVYTKCVLIFFVLCFSNNLLAEVLPQPLSGTVIAYDERNRTNNTPAEAFDENLDTYFQSDGVFGNWIGLDLGSPHIITSVDFYSRKDNKPEEYAARLELGVFEGANNPDFGDAIALTIIPEPPAAGQNTLTINSSKGFRYVRFLFPSNAKHTTEAGLSKYIGEMKFFGYPGTGDNSQLPTLTNLPTVNIHTVNAQEISSKENYLNGIVTIVYDGGTKVFTDSLQIRGRGNNSWSHPKKPYRMKLYNSTKLMDLPAKGKNWTLINNYGDKTLMRNMLAFDFSRRLEMPYTSPAVGVDVVLNGDYKGCYQLCDHIDVRKNRVDIEEMTPDDLTGGYHLEIDAYADGEIKKFTTSKYNLKVTIKDPGDSDITPAQEQYIANHFNKMTNAIDASNFKDKTNGYRKYLDTQTFLRHFLVGEYAGNTDTYWSVRMYKYRDDDKFYTGPVWDFDLGFENDWRTYSITEWANQDNEWVCLSDRSSAVGNMKGLIRRLMSDADFDKELKGIYAYYRDKRVINKEILENVVDSLETMLYQSQTLNFKRWPIINIKVHENPVLYGSYEGEVDNVRYYIENRIDWMDQKLAYVPNLSDIRDEDADISVVIQRLNNSLFVRNIPDNSTIRIMNLQGMMCYQNRNVNEFSVDLNNGVYVLVVETETKTYTYKCLVQ
ncbi:MAG: CotH kinase family protein [Candidatus Pacearchaeota archaeon]